MYLQVGLAVGLTFATIALLRKRHRRAKVVTYRGLVSGDVLLNAPKGAILRPANSFQHVRLAIACMTKNPIAFETWLRHHRNMGVELFFLTVEDTPELSETLNKKPWTECVQATFSSGRQAYFTLMDRQAKHVNASIEKARQAGCTHLVHIDDDELLFCPNGTDVLRSHLANVHEASCLHMQNIEAVYDASECTDPFKQTRTFCVRPSSFTAYSNGKSIASLAHTSVKTHGPHMFSGKIHELSAYIVVVLHFESSCLDRWNTKFQAYAADSPTACAEGKIPFPFYCESMAAMEKASSAPETWQKWKTRGRHPADSLVELSFLRA